MSDYDKKRREEEEARRKRQREEEERAAQDQLNLAVMTAIICSII
jgi:hypothetical protein